MSPNRLRLTAYGLQAASAALLKIFGKNKTRLAVAANVDRTTIHRFFKRENLAFNNFEAICLELELDWQQVGEPPLLPAAAMPALDDVRSLGLDALVQRVRSCVQLRVQHDCAAMQLLVLQRNIETDGIYININLIHSSQLQAYGEVDEVMPEGEADIVNFDRLGLPGSQKISGEEAVQRYERLLVYGKPGSGKTTYLQWIAMRCIEGAIFADHVPIFLAFKDFAEAENRPSLQTYLEQYLSVCPISNPGIVVNRLLLEGRILLLFDGLDEVQESDRNRVRSQVTELIARFSKCRFVFSCRPPLQMRVPNFEKVFVAEFNRQQIGAFAQRWFQILHQEDRSRPFMDQLSSHIAIAELARTPLLLTLLCLMFNSDGRFPNSRSELYRRGLKILLEQWDEFRNVARDNPYRGLTSRAKEALLRRIATQFFLEQKILFWQRDAELIIEEFFQKFFKIDPLHIDAGDILEAIELQHGLIVTGSSNYCSFSHLTFQEYFTASHLVSTDQYEVVYRHITEQRWRFVIELIAELLDQQKIDRFLENFKQALDQVVISNTKIRGFLYWLDTFVSSIASTVQTDQRYKQTLLRTWYFVFTLEDPGATSSVRQFSRKPLHFPDYYIATSMISGGTLELHMLMYRAFHANSAQHELFLNSVRRVYDQVKNRDLYMETSLAGWFTEMQQQQVHYRHKPDWWRANHAYWKERVQKFMNIRLNLRCDWNFSEEERRILRQYYDATKLLAECMNRSLKVAPSTYHKLAENLLKLGIEEI